MNTQLTDLMQRATENLEPVTPDLLERSVAQGLRLRRRRTTLLAASGTGAVLATAGLIAGGIQLLDSPTDTAVAGTPIAIGKPSTVPSVEPSAIPSSGPSTEPMPSTTTHAGVNAKETLATLKALLQAPGRTFSSPETWGDGSISGAAYVVNDGHGAVRVDVLLSGGGEQNPCMPARQGCSTLPDGSVLFTSKESPEYTDGRQAEFGVVSNYVVLFRRDGRNINLTSYNAPAQKGKQHTRPTPLLSVKDLTTLAKSKVWQLPPHSSAKGSK
ncbi:hypothetical protein [Kribbella shirazensis]|uniref:Uncharacterized protein n=1 Tax=Kribbella shirazensis TaxID=1105143 RepID=A0A7X5VHA9_9ACTN|nr:hypothetical protein [Kribbella shirazensis]NIK61275.1 hypothetical protein [Kribbella shirazensis]